MALQAFPFSGTTFFTNVRGKMDLDRGMFAGTDADFRYVCMDSNFYRFEVFERTSTQTFTDAVSALSTDIRTAANGQTFQNSCYIAPIIGGAEVAPCPGAWDSEVMIQHNVLKGTGDQWPDRTHFGQWDGRSAVAFGHAKGAPSAVTLPGTYNHALGALNPLIYRQVMVPNAILGNWVWKGPRVGKMILGVHRTAQVVFILAQQHFYLPGSAPPHGMAMLDVQALLDGMGVDDAAIADSSDSVTLMVDGTLELIPAGFPLYKRYSIPIGFCFRLQSLALETSATLTKDDSNTTDPAFQGALVASGQQGTIRLISPGSAIDLTSLGARLGETPAAFAAALGIALPLRLTASTSLLSVNTRFLGTNADSMLILESTATTDSRMTGTLAITTTGGLVVFDVDWPLTPAP